MTDDPRNARASAIEVIEFGGLPMTSNRDGNAQVIELFGELDLDNGERLALQPRRVGATDRASIVVDVSGLSFVGSTGARLVRQAAIRSRADAIT